MLKFGKTTFMKTMVITQKKQALLYKPEHLNPVFGYLSESYLLLSGRSLRELKLSFPYSIIIKVSLQYDLLDLASVENEFMIQGDIETVLNFNLKQYVDTYKVLSLIHDGYQIHYWFTGKEISNNLFKSISREVDDLRLISATVNEDKEWSSIAPVMEKIKNNFNNF